MIEMFIGSFLGVCCARLLIEIYFSRRFKERLDALENDIEDLEEEIELLKENTDDD